MMVLFFAVLGCINTDVLPALSPSLTEVSVTLDSAAVASGAPVVVEISALTAEGWTVQAGVPFSEGLEVELLSEEGPTVVDERQLMRRRFKLTGPDGSYVIGTTETHAQGPEEQERDIESPPLFVDIGVTGPSGGPMDGFAHTPPPPPDKTRRYAMIAAAVLAALGLLLWWRRRRARRGAQAPPPVPAHILAQGAWADARATISADHPLAVRLSMVLREYLEARSGYPASKATTAEIWTAMERVGIDGRPLGPELRQSIAQILDATDRLKFARLGGGGDFFDELDKHFGMIINHTRPVPAEADDA